MKNIKYVNIKGEQYIFGDTYVKDLNDTSDLNFGDEQGNIIATFEDGHIKTKNFDSSNIKTSSSSTQGGNSSNPDYEKTLQEHANKITVLESNDNNITTEMSALKAADNNLSAEISVLKNKDTTLSSNITQLQEKVTDNTNQIVALQSKGNSVDSQIGNIKNSLTGYNNIINSNTARVTELENALKNSNVNTKPFSGKTYSIIGDSISTFSGYLVSDNAGYSGSKYAIYYPKTGLTSVEDTWWRKLEKLSGLTLANNCSWSGSKVTGDSTSTTNAAAACSTKRVADVGMNTTPDIIIIFIGINNFNNNNSPDIGTWTGDSLIPNEGTITTFSDAYALMVKKVLEKYPSSEVFCCTLLDTGYANMDSDNSTAYPSKNAKGYTTRLWNDTIKMVANSLGAKILDVHSCGINYWNQNIYTIDRLHPNASGATLIAQLMNTELNAKSIKLY